MCAYPSPHSHPCRRVPTPIPFLRYTVFAANLVRAEELNSEGHATFGVTKFADLTAAEFKATYLGRKTLAEHSDFAAFNASECPACKRFPEMANYTADSLDWVAKGAVTPVKNQAQVKRTCLYFASCVAD